MTCLVTTLLLVLFQSPAPAMDRYLHDEEQRQAELELERFYRGVLEQHEVALNTPALVAALRLSDPTLKVGALHFLAKTKDPSLRSGLRPLLEDRDPRVRLAAAGALLALDDPSGLGVVLAELKNENPQIRLDAVSKLVPFGRLEGKRPEVVSALVAAVADVSADVRAAAAIGLGTTGDGAAMAALDRAAAAEKDPTVKLVIEQQQRKVRREP